MDTGSSLVIVSLLICISWLQSTFKPAMFSKMQVLRLNFYHFYTQTAFLVHVLSNDYSLPVFTSRPAAQ